MAKLRNTVGTAISGAAQGLNLASKLLEATAKTLRPSSSQQPPQQTRPPASSDTPPQGSDVAQTADEVTDNVAHIGRVVEAPGTPVLDETPHLRTYESHIEELADKPAAQVAQAVSGLSTDELRLLTEYEMAHKNRRTVLGAIEKALAPDLATPNSSSGGRSSAAAKRGKKGEEREIVLPEAGGVPTSGTMDASKA